ncbi:MAG: hypothetical protein ACE5E1_07790 [Phycisphaerae bacterium]
MPEDSAEATEALNGKPNTLALLNGDDVSLARAVGDSGDVHQLTVFTDDAGNPYLAEYRFQTAEGVLTVSSNATGQPERIELEDKTAGAGLQIMLAWTDSTHADATMTTGADDTPTTFSLVFPSPVGTARTVGAGDRFHRLPVHKSATTAQTSTENDLLLFVQIAYRDSSGNPVSGLQPRVQLRSLDTGAIFGVGRAVQSGSAGTYLAPVPAYRFQRVRGDYPEWKPYFESGVILIGTATAIVGVIPSAPLWLTVGAGVTGFGATTIVPAVVSRLNEGVFSNVPYPTALGQNIGFFEVRAFAGDLRNTTVIKPISYGELYNDHVNPGVRLDLGVVTVEPAAQQTQATGFRVWRITNYTSAAGGYVAVLGADADQNPPLLKDFDGGGIDPNLRAQLTALTGEFSSRDAAVDSLCSRVSGFFRPVLASFIQMGHLDGEEVGIDDIFVTRCGP